MDDENVINEGNKVIRVRFWDDFVIYARLSPLSALRTHLPIEHVVSLVQNAKQEMSTRLQAYKHSMYARLESEST